MATQVIIHGREVNQPAIKATLIFAAVVFAALVTAVVVFVLLPLIGVVITLSAGVAAILLMAAMFGISTLIFSAAIVAWCFGPSEIHFKKRYKPR